MNNLISIIIPTFNRAEKLGGTVNSVVSQTHQQWELIIIDDGSTDSTKTVINNFISDKRIKYFFQNNQGVSSARNFGAEKSEGDYLIFLDSDDTLEPSLLSHLYSIPLYNYDIICWEVIKIINGKKTIWKPTKLEKIYNNITATFLAGSICYRKQIFLEVGGFDDKMCFGENYELGLRISQVANLRINILKEPFLNFNINTYNRPSSSISNKLKSNYQLYHKHQGKFKHDPISHARFKYLMGYLYEKKGMKDIALKYYKESFSIKKTYLKPLFKIVFFHFKGENRFFG